MNGKNMNENNKEWMILVIIIYLFILLCLATICRKNRGSS